MGMDYQHSRGCFCGLVSNMAPQVEIGRGRRPSCNERSSPPKAPKRVRVIHRLPLSEGTLYNARF